MLLIWRHRFITDTWGWEIPAGRIEPDESPEEAAVRKRSRKRAGGPGRRTASAPTPNNGSTDQVFHLFIADGGT